MALDETRFPIGTTGREAQIYHMGYPPTVTGRPIKTEVGHGPMFDTGEAVDGRTIAECPSCQWQGWFTRIRALLAPEKRRSLRMRMNGLNSRIAPFVEQSNSGKMAPGKAEQLTAVWRAEQTAKNAQLESLRPLGDSDIVGATFEGTRAGGLILHLIDVEPVSRPNSDHSEEISKPSRPRPAKKRPRTDAQKAADRARGDLLRGRAAEATSPELAAV
jgi:hypothetical protein